MLSRKDIHILLSYKRSHISLFIAAKENVLCLQHNDTEIWCLYVYYLISSSYINIINNKNMYTINSNGVIMLKWMMVQLTFLTQNWWKWIGWLKRRLEYYYKKFSFLSLLKSAHYDQAQFVILTQIEVEVECVWLCRVTFVEITMKCILTFCVKMSVIVKRFLLAHTCLKHKITLN